MDTNILHDYFAAILKDSNSRIQVENQLSQAEKIPGFIISCLEIVREKQVAQDVRHQAATYLKNIVTRNWNPNNVKGLISAEDKARFRTELIPTLLMFSGLKDSRLRAMLLACLNILVSLDYPENWPTLLNETEQLISLDSDDHKFTSVLILVEITKRYRYVTGDSREHLDEIIVRIFPTLFQLASSLVVQYSFYAGDILKNILKIYKYATYYKLPRFLQSNIALQQWTTLHLQCVSHSLSDDVLRLSEEEQELNPWVKCQKWGFCNLHRLLTRYGSSTIFGSEYDEFSRNFITNYVPEILKIFFSCIEAWVGGMMISRKSLYALIFFLEECLRTKQNYALIKDHIDTIVRHVIYPLLCLNDKDLEAFEEEPVEYIHRRIDVVDESNTPDIAAASFIVTLVDTRSSCLRGVLQLIQEIVQNNSGSADMSIAIKHEGALRMLGIISHIIIRKKKNSQYLSMIEPFLLQYVLPDFESPHGFIRARACELVNSYADIEFTSETIQMLYTNILHLLGDKYLPVRAEAALALQPLIQFESVKLALADNITSVMQQLLDLSNEIEFDAISAVLEDFVESFSEHLTSFAVQLAKQLCDQFMRIALELNDRKSDDPNSYEIANLQQDEDKTLAAEGVLNTVISLVLAMDNDAQSIYSIEELLMPIYKLVLENGFIEFLSPVFELIEDTTFCVKAISPNMWLIFDMLHDIFLEHAMDFVSELYCCLENYLNYGADMFRQSTERMSKIWNIINSILTESEGRLSWQEKIYACRLIQTLVLNFHGYVDNYLENVISNTICCLKEPDIKPAYLVHLLENIIACMVHNHSGVLILLQQYQYLETFFSLWFDSMNLFTRVNDKKLSCLALLNLIRIELPQSLQQNFTMLFQGLISIMKTLPEAEKYKAQISKEFDVSQFNDECSEESYYDEDDDFNYEYSFDELDSDEDFINDNNGVKNENDDKINRLKAEEDRLISSSFRFHDGDVVEEDAVDDMPTDKINIYLEFKTQFESLRQNDNSLYQQLISSLDASQIKILEDIYNRALT